MKKYLIASHGKLADGLKSSIKILTGKTNIQTIAAYLDGSDNKSNLDENLDKFLDSLNNDDYGIIFTDLLGGSVNREVMMKVNGESNVVVITSVNLPTVMSVILDTEEPTEKHLQKLIDQSQVQISKMPKKENVISDDDFLS